MAFSVGFMIPRRSFIWRRRRVHPTYSSLFSWLLFEVKEAYEGIYRDRHDIFEWLSAKLESATYESIRRLSGPTKRV